MEGGWVGPRTVLDVRKGKITCPCQDMSQRSSSLQPGCCTNYTIVAVQITVLTSYLSSGKEMKNAALLLYTQDIV
jgi:hypothetical protein